MPIKNARDASEPNTVKVILNAEGNALNFSRAMVSWDRDAGGFSDSGLVLQHKGLYGYRAGYLRKYPTLQRTSLEEIEKMEQLRVLYHEGKIHVSITNSVFSVGVDTEQDLERVRKMSPR